MSTPEVRPAPVSVPQLGRMKAEGRRISMLTCYDATFAFAMDRAGVDTVLVGDSLGMVVQGHDSTLPVTVDHIVYHSAAVARGLSRALLVADMPFLSYATPGRALDAGIIAPRWLSMDEIRARQQSEALRSPLVLRCCEDLLAGRRYPLDLLTHFSGAAGRGAGA